MTQTKQTNAKDYLLNLFKYSSMALNDVVPITYSYYIFNLNDSSECIKIAGLMFCFNNIFTAFAFDFSELISTLCLPFLEKGNTELYSQKVWKVGVFNVFFFVFGFLAFCAFKMLISGYLDLSSFVHSSLEQTPKFILLAGLPQTASNFCVGRVN